MEKNSRVLPLKKKDFFKKVFEDGFCFSSGNVLLKTLFSKTSNNEIYIGFAVSKKASFSVVKKNKVKRLLKNGVVQNLAFIEENVSSGHFVLFFSGRSLPEAKSLFKNVLAAFKKVVAKKNNT